MSALASRNAAILLATGSSKGTTLSSPLDLLAMGTRSRAKRKASDAKNSKDSLLICILQLWGPLVGFLMTPLYLIF